MTETLNVETTIDISDDRTKKGKIKIKKESNCKRRKENAVVAFCNSNWKAILTEMLSTATLLLFGCMCCIPIDGFTVQPPLYGALGFGLTVFVNVHTFGHISGAHMNPAVTLVAVVTRITPMSLGIAYVIVQFIGALLGYGLLVVLSPKDLVSGRVCATVPHGNQHVLQTLGIEIALTAMLGLVCCSAWDPVNKKIQDSMSLKFGFMVAALSMAGGPLTGASMNPARTFAPALLTSTWTAHWAYWAGPLIGSSLAIPIYWMITPSKDDTKEEQRSAILHVTRTEYHLADHLVHADSAHNLMEESTSKTRPKEFDSIQLQRLLSKNNILEVEEI